MPNTLLHACAEPSTWSAQYGEPQEGDRVTHGSLREVEGTPTSCLRLSACTIPRCYLDTFFPDSRVNMGVTACLDGNKEKTG